MSRGLRYSGFSLIEMMVVVAVIAILAAIAYPSYQAQIRKARRADAGSVLLDAAQFTERFYSENTTYVGVALPVTLLQSPKEGAARFYNISFPDPLNTTVTSSTYILRATPIGAQIGDGLLEYTNTGVKRWDRDNSGAFDADENCWRRSC